MPLAIVGSGAMGSLLAALLARQSEVVMLGHWPEQIAQLRAEGLTLEHPDGGHTTHRFPVRDKAAQMPPADLALVLVKAYQTERAAAEAKRFLRPGGLAVTLQNGLGNVDLLASELGRERVTQGVTSAGATMLAPGHVRFAGHGPSHLAGSPEQREALQGLANLLRGANLEAHLTEDILALAWGKLVVNSGINPLTALLHVPNGTLDEEPRARALMCAVAAETAAVARALGIQLPYADPARRVREVARATAANRSSMLQDVLRGAPTEIDAICGAVVRYGRQSRVPTPLNAELLRLVHALPAVLQSEVPAVQALLEARIGQ